MSVKGLFLRFFFSVYNFRSRIEFTKRKFLILQFLSSNFKLIMDSLATNLA